METDLADRLDDLICAFDAGFSGSSGNIETVVFVLFGWVVLSTIVYCIVVRYFKLKMVSLLGIARHCLVLLGIAWHCLELLGIA
jgi:hypothetical protein